MNKTRKAELSCRKLNVLGFADTLLASFYHQWVALFLGWGQRRGFDRHRWSAPGSGPARGPKVARPEGALRKRRNETINYLIAFHIVSVPLGLMIAWVLNRFQRPSLIALNLNSKDNVRQFPKRNTGDGADQDRHDRAA